MSDVRRHTTRSTSPPIFLRGRSRGPVVRGLEIAAGAAAALYLSLLVAGLMGAPWVPSLSLPGVGEVFPQGNQELRTPALAQELDDKRSDRPPAPEPPVQSSPPLPGGAGTGLEDDVGRPQKPDARSTSPRAEEPGKSTPAGPAEPARPDQPGDPDPPAAAPAAEEGSTRGNSSQAPRATPEPGPHGQGTDHSADPEERSSGRSRRDQS